MLPVTHTFVSTSFPCPHNVTFIGKYPTTTVLSTKLRNEQSFQNCTQEELKLLDRRKTYALAQSARE